MKHPNISQHGIKMNQAGTDIVWVLVSNAFVNCCHGTSDYAK
jgi:hypothetical protein